MAAEDAEKGTAALNVIEMHEMYKHLLTPQALAALEPNKPTTLYSFDAENGPSAYSRAIYLSAIAHSAEGIDKAARQLYAEVNELAAMGKLRGHLTRLSMLTIGDLRKPSDLHEYTYPDGVETKSYAVYVFPHVLLDWNAKGTKFEAEEGGIGLDIEPEKKGPAPIHSPDCKTCHMFEKRVMMPGPSLNRHD